MTIDRSSLTFEQAEGLEPLPSQLELRTVSPALRAGIWEVIYASMDGTRLKDAYGTKARSLAGSWTLIMKDWHVHHENMFIDEFSSDFKVNVQRVKTIISEESYGRFFGFLEFAASHPQRPRALDTLISSVLQKKRAAYRLIEGHIIPVSSDEQAFAVQQALQAASGLQAQGPIAHLRAASGLLKSADWAGCVRESIHAVEAAAKALAPDAATLGPALKVLQTRGLHPALAKAFSNLYGYTSDEQGVRHALVLDDAAAGIGEAEALFMFGACATFVGFLAAKSAATT